MRARPKWNQRFNCHSAVVRVRVKFEGSGQGWPQSPELQTRSLYWDQPPPTDGGPPTDRSQKSPLPSTGIPRRRVERAYIELRFKALKVEILQLQALRLDQPRARQRPSPGRDEARARRSHATLFFKTGCWRHRRHGLHGILRPRRQYFQREQSMPELIRFWEGQLLPQNGLRLARHWIQASEPFRCLWICVDICRTHGSGVESCTFRTRLNS